jgi:hypothetical protein
MAERHGRQIRQGLFLFATGYHPAGWRLPGARADGGQDPVVLASRPSDGGSISSFSVAAGRCSRWLQHLPAYLPGGLDLFVELVVPELQRRGLLRREYQGTTFRDLLGCLAPTGRSPPPETRRVNESDITYIDDDARPP